MTTRIMMVFLVGAVTTALLMLAEDWTTRFIGLSVILGCLAYLGMKMDQIRRQLEDVAGLRAAYDQLDQQAKLIIRTDVELHRTQEELDRRVASLMSLHGLSQQLQVGLRPDEIYERLDAQVLAPFGFARVALGVAAGFDDLTWRALVGMTPEVGERLAAHLKSSGLLKRTLTDPSPKTVRGEDRADASMSVLHELVQTDTAVIAGIVPHTGPPGLLVVGCRGVSAADEELVAILANRLATAVENAALYEEAWRAKQDLERKVRERTHDVAEANAELTRLTNAKSAFVSAVSHELRTPLAAIKGYASLLTAGQFGRLADPQRERIAKIEKHADLLTQLINNLLDIARIESGRVTMEQRAIPLEDFFSTVRDQVRPQMDAKHLEYREDLDGVRELTGDPQQLRRVFVNLLSNAIKYTPEGGRITVGLRRDGGHILATVSDTGCGIPADDVPKLFQEFYRALDPVNQQIQGTGLGLALVKRIVEAHHGRITVDSTRGKGTTFSITLPVS